MVQEAFVSAASALVVSASVVSVSAPLLSVYHLFHYMDETG